MSNSRLEILAPLGDPQKKYPVVLTEPEINTIHAMAGFMLGMKPLMRVLPKPTVEFLNHYLPTLEALSKSLGKYDDEPPKDAS